ncbi:Uncharacterised protein [Yersinia frederiksenii]|nr:Uncharacterised protein [Yersinia frederiksenii]
MNLDQLKRAASIPQERAEEWLPILKAVFEEFDINTPLNKVLVMSFSAGLWLAVRNGKGLLTAAKLSVKYA